LAKTFIPVLVLLSSVAILQANAFANNDSTSQRRATFTSATILVPENYTSIQDAVNAANRGDTIYVNSGTYYENIYVNKTITLVGKNPETTIIDGSKSNTTFDPVVWLSGESAKEAILGNFTIQGSSSAWGIYVTVSPNVTIESNIISNNHGGIVLDASSNDSLIDNTVTNNTYEGALLFQSSENTMKNNTINHNLYNFGIQESAFDNDIDESNLINGKPICYLRNRKGVTINPTTYPKIGYLALINCSDMNVENLNLTNNYNGILIAQTRNTSLTDNTLSSNIVGISIYNSAGNVLQNNSVTDNWQGITLTDSPNNTFKQNNLAANQQHFAIKGAQLNHFLQDIDTSNTVDTKLVRYMANQSDLTITPFTFPDTGYLALVSCHNITAQALSIQNNVLLVAFSQNSTITQNHIIKGGISLQHASYINLSTNDLTDCDAGITISDSDNNTIAMNNIAQNSEYGILLTSSTSNVVMDNDIAENKIGIRLDASANNSIIGNNITANKYYGINLWDSHYNAIYHNNFVNNSQPGWQAVCSNILFRADNKWDNGYPSGGNYWSDYNGTDQHGSTNQNANGPDAIGDAPYNVNFGQRDRYPLISPHHDFTVVAGQAYHLEIVSNSSIANLTLAVWLSSPIPYLQPGQQYLWFFIAGETNTTGFCRVTIPRNVLNRTYVVLVDWHQVPAAELEESNSTHAYLYFTYGQSEHETVILPEYPSATFLSITIMAITTVAIIAAKKRSKLGTKAFHSN
jgi:parallel beta-helix repeat protein